MKKRRLYRIVRVTVVYLPVFFFFCTLVLPFVPGALGLFSDRPSPWYQGVTAPVFLAALFYAYPVTLFCTRLISDDLFLSPGYYLILATYTALWVIFLRTFFWSFERRGKDAA
ncbi:MAG TPA: hypothetical protein VM940_14575 [Chthoniobacterales bacterium]|jgi:hypothetical protein|nr:hypothetical protein [Chthoniobacterales bacterium]